MQIRIAGADIYLALRPTRSEDGRQVWDVAIFLPDDAQDGHHTTLSSGCYGELTEAGAAETLLAFLSAAAEATPEGDNYDLFDAPVMAWARANAGEIEDCYCMAQAPIGNAEGSALA